MLRGRRPIVLRGRRPIVLRGQATYRVKGRPTRAEDSTGRGKGNRDTRATEIQGQRYTSYKWRHGELHGIVQVATRQATRRRTSTRSGGGWLRDNRGEGAIGPSHSSQRACETPTGIGFEPIIASLKIRCLTVRRTRKPKNRLGGNRTPTNCFEDNGTTTMLQI